MRRFGGGKKKFGTPCMAIRDDEGNCATSKSEVANLYLRHFNKDDRGIIINEANNG